MKNLLFAFTLICTLFASTNAFAYGPVAPETKKVIRNEVVKLLDLEKLGQYQIKDQVVTISFIVSSNDEIIVTNINTNSSLVEDYCKNHLNYKKLNVKAVDKTEQYTVKLNFKTK